MALPAENRKGDLGTAKLLSFILSSFQPLSVTEHAAFQIMEAQLSLCCPNLISRLQTFHYILISKQLRVLNHKHTTRNFKSKACSNVKCFY